MDRIKLLVGLVLLVSCKANPVTKLPVVKFERRWATQLADTPMEYNSFSLQISGDTLFVLNGADNGNAILKFDLEGKYLGEFPGWYNWPIDLVVGGDPESPQPLLSATGAMNDTGFLHFGMVLYNGSGNFFHGFMEADTGMKRPYGIAMLPGGNQLAVCDWQGNRTVFIDVGWTEGKVSASSDPIIPVPYPAKLAVSTVKDFKNKTVVKRYVITSSVCCYAWHEKMRVMRLFDQDGKLLKTVKNLPNGDKINYPDEVSVDPLGNILLVEEGRTTHFFDPEANYIGDIKELHAPKKIVFNKGKVYTVGRDLTDERFYVNVFSYSN